MHELKNIELIIKNKFPNKKIKNIDLLGEGLVAEAYKVEFIGNIKPLVVRKTKNTNGGMSKDYNSDKVGYFLLQHTCASNHINHCKSYGISFKDFKGEIFNLDTIKDTYQVIDYVSGKEFFETITNLEEKFDLVTPYLDKIIDYLVQLHSIKPDFNKQKTNNLYNRHLKDVIGSEVFLDVLDAWSENDDLVTLKIKEKVNSKLFILREQYKNNYKRCSRIHADLHFGNIFFNMKKELTVLDSARNPWGEPADDLICLLINFDYISIKKHKEITSYYENIKQYILKRYLEKTKDSDIKNYFDLFYILRLFILLNPNFFNNNNKVRKILFEKLIVLL